MSCDARTLMCITEGLAMLGVVPDEVRKCALCLPPQPTSGWNRQLLCYMKHVHKGTFHLLLFLIRNTLTWFPF